MNKLLINLICLIAISITVLPVQAQGSRSTDLSLQAQAREPFKIFDNFYFIGVDFVSSYLIVTSDGLIVIDALFHDYGDYLPGNIEKLGFNPEDVEYILITHGHHDHYGGAAYLQDKMRATVGAAEKDWELMESNASVLAPKRGRVFNDGDLLTLGDTSIKFYITPGHTPGVMSMEFMVKDGDRVYKAFSFSGSGVNDLSNGQAIASFRKSHARISAMEGIQVNVVNHPFLMKGYFERMDKIPTRKMGEKHPFVLESGEYGQWLKNIIVNLDKRLAKQ